MKKLPVALVMLLVLGVCAQSYGFLVVYNVASTVRGLDDETAVTIPLKGYLVLNLDDADGDLVDANLILYGKNPAKHKVYVVLNDSDSNDFLDISMRPQGNYQVLNFSGAGFFIFRVLSIGKVKATNVGLDEKKEIATALQGVISVFSGVLLDTSQDITATGGFVAVNWTPATKFINKEGWTQDQIVAQLKTDLEDDRYNPVALPAP